MSVCSESIGGCVSVLNNHTREKDTIPCRAGRNTFIIEIVVSQQFRRGKRERKWVKEAGER